MAGSHTKPQSRKRLVARILLTAALLAALFTLLAQSLVLPARQPQTLQRLFSIHADSPRAIAADYPALAQTLSDYLSKRSQELPQVRLQDGSEAFSANELLHLKDVRQLFSLANHLMIISWVFLALLIVWFWYTHKADRRAVLKTVSTCGFLAAAMLFTLLLFLLLWAAIDFQSLFYVFHQVLFTNDLWLLDPAHDLLIQLMPLPFFIQYAQEALLLAAVVLLVYGGVMVGLRMMARRSYEG